MDNQRRITRITRSMTKAAAVNAKSQAQSKSKEFNRLHERITRSMTTRSMTKAAAVNAKSQAQSKSKEFNRLHELFVEFERSRNLGASMATKISLLAEIFTYIDKNMFRIGLTNCALKDFVNIAVNKYFEQIRVIHAHAAHAAEEEEAEEISQEFIVNQIVAMSYSIQSMQSKLNKLK